MAFTLLHQLQLGRELAALRGGELGPGAAAGAGDGAARGAAHGGGLVEGLMASALTPLVAVAGNAQWVLQGLSERLGVRGPGPQ